ncbi:Aldo/keto reductase [Marasmius fiardii PR-910]|nr:Aldo/keto reductase [Marasmius fiardii PR-910]
MSIQTTITLNDNTQIPWVGFGTGTALYSQDVKDIVATAIRAGVRHLDGAQVYGNEDSLGAGIRESGVPRSQLFVTTKLNEKIDIEKETPKTKLLESLKKLRLDYVDLYLIHSPAYAQEHDKLQQWWKVMEECKKEGLARSIGVSNHDVNALEEVLEVATITPSVNQIEFHPYVWKAAKPIYDFCKEKGIVIESYGGLVPVYRSSGGPLDPVLERIAQRLTNESGRTVTLAHVLTKWQIQKGVAIVTTSRKEYRIKETLEIPSLPDLTEDEVTEIEQVGSKVHQRIFMKHCFK